MNIVLIRSNPIRPYPRLEKMANCLLKQGYGVYILGWDRDSDYQPQSETLQLNNGIAWITRIGIKGQFSGGIKKNLRGFLHFQSFIKEWLYEHAKLYDVIHAYDLDTGLTAQRVAKKLNKQFVYDIPDYFCDSHGYSGLVRTLVRSVENRVINRSFATIICTEERKKQIVGSNPQRLIVIHNTPDIQIKDQDKHAHIPVRLVYIGIFGKIRFLDTIAETVAARKDCELHIGGYGADMESYFENMSRKYDNIFYYGRIPYQRTLEIEKAGDVMLAVYSPDVNNHKYAAPNKFYEALALGKPLIMAKGTGMASVVEKYNLGETIEYNADGLNKAIDRLIDRKDEWDEIGRKEQKLYESTYSWAKMEKRIYHLYNELEKTVKGK